MREDQNKITTALNTIFDHITELSNVFGDKTPEEYLHIVDDAYHEHSELVKVLRKLQRKSLGE